MQSETRKKSWKGWVILTIGFLIALVYITVDGLISARSISSFFGSVLGRDSDEQQERLAGIIDSIDWPSGYVLTEQREGGTSGPISDEGRLMPRGRLLLAVSRATRGPVYLFLQLQKGPNFNDAPFGPQCPKKSWQQVFQVTHISSR